jgi:hypothetical protein
VARAPANIAYGATTMNFDRAESVFEGSTIGTHNPMLAFDDAGIA